MDLISQYSAVSNGGSDNDDAEPDPIGSRIKLNAAPEVNATSYALVDNRAVEASKVQHLQPATARKTYVNLPLSQMHAAVVGPAHPFTVDGLAAGAKNHRSGHVEDTHLNHYNFDDQYNTFHSLGYAHEPQGHSMVGDVIKSAGNHGGSIFSNQGIKRRKTEGPGGDQTAPEFDPEQPFALHTRQPWTDKEVAPAVLNEEQKTYLAQVAREKAEKAAADPEKHGPGDSASFFHGKETRDATGKSWLQAPKGLKEENEFCYLPKRWIHTWSGHTKGVNAIRFFPKTGHLLLSAGLDGKIKMWDVNGSRKCMRSYLGHTKGVKDINFNIDGTKFLSTSYDKAGIKLWDTETGKVISTLGAGKMFYVAKLHPNEDKQNMLFAGCGDNAIHQFDVNSGDTVQTYNYHLASVNTITFVDEGRRFVSTSDDKTIRVWELGIPVQIKYIADPKMHSIPAVSVHPSGRWFCGQSLDNKIVTYSALDRFSVNSKKVFTGHTNAGYACQVGFSADGRYVLSGDGSGKCYCWDWKTTKIFRTFKAHEGVCIGCEWHPLESSKVATCGWDGLIKYWD